MNITIFAATNRINSRAFLFSNFVAEILNQKGINTSILDLSKIKSDYIHSAMYESKTATTDIMNICNEFIRPAEKFYFVIPEYNGSFPGVLKTFIDACSVLPGYGGFQGKKAALLGISSGRAGNLRGMDHFSAILNYISVTIMPNKQPISSIEGLLGAKLAITDNTTIKVIEQHAQDFIDF
jgi:chromate reductase, NAD(P)H dehydrogenase (quinone)